MSINRLFCKLYFLNITILYIMKIKKHRYVNLVCVFLEFQSLTKIPVENKFITHGLGWTNILDTLKHETVDL